MPITIDHGAGPIEIPEIGDLVWADERDWSPVVQTIDRVFGGAVVVEEWVRTAGQPMTLEGGADFAWISQAALDALRAALDVPASQHTLELDDGRTYTVTARRTEGPPVESRPVPRVLDSGLADADDTALHVLERVRLLILEGPL